MRWLAWLSWGGVFLVLLGGFVLWLRFGRPRNWTEQFSKRWRDGLTWGRGDGADDVVRFACVVVAVLAVLPTAVYLVRRLGSQRGFAAVVATAIVGLLLIVVRTAWNAPAIHDLGDITALKVLASALYPLGIVLPVGALAGWFLATVRPT